MHDTCTVNELHNLSAVVQCDGDLCARMCAACWPTQCMIAAKDTVALLHKNRVDAFDEHGRLQHSDVTHSQLPCKCTSHGCRSRCDAGDGCTCYAHGACADTLGLKGNVLAVEFDRVAVFQLHDGLHVGLLMSL